MLKRIRISVIAPTLLPNNLVHYATNFKISKSIIFSGDDLIVDKTETVNLYDENFTVDMLEDDNLYIVTQYIYKVVDENGVVQQDTNGEDIIKYGTPSRISSIRGSQEGVKISDTIVSTPTVIIGASYLYNLDGNVMLKTSDFKMFSSSGLHKASSWVVKDVSGNTIFKREYDLDNLTSIILPDNIKLEDNFIVYVRHHSDTNADSNYGMKENIISNELPKFNVTNINKFIVGKYLYFNVELLNKRFKSIKLVISLNGVEVDILENITSSLIKVSTVGFTEKVNYDFDFYITSENGIIVPVRVTLFSHNYKDLFEYKTYLDEYDYLGLLFTNGNTSNFSYQLSNGSILLQKNDTNYVVDSQVTDTTILYLDSVITLEERNINYPNLYVNELLNGDIVIYYKNYEGHDFINVYGLNPEDNRLTLINSMKLDNKLDDSITFSGGITVIENDIYYVEYTGVEAVLKKISNYEAYPYTDIGGYNTMTIEYIATLPYNVKHGVGITSDMNGNIIIAGGTDNDVNDYNIMHKRKNDKAYIFNTKEPRVLENSVEVWNFKEIGIDILQDVPEEIYQFHMVYRHDGKITMFNNINNINYTVIGDQSTYILDHINKTLDSRMNDHLDKLPYTNTIVLRNGDVVRFTSMIKDPQKMYTYVADSMVVDDINDDNTLMYDPTKIIVLNGERVHIPKPCMYDSITINPGGLVTLGDDMETTYDSTVLIITRDMVLTQGEFRFANYSMVYKACSDARFILVG